MSAVLVAALAVIVLAGFAPPASAETVTYEAPVIGRVTDPFRPPSTPYGRGNRGLTYETEPGSPVSAAAPGRVTFAGQVGGALHVVIAHADGVRTSYSFLRTVTVRVGQQVRQRDRVGTTNDSFHFGARIGDAYIDPAILLSSGPARVHLVPDGEFAEVGASNDRASLLAAVSDGFGSVSAAAAEWARGVATGAIDVSSAAARAAAEHLVTVLDQIVNLGQFAGPFASMSAAFADILQAFLEPCTPADVPAPTQDGNGRIAVFVAGLGSHNRGPQDGELLSNGAHAKQLGYAQENIYDFSYRGGRHPRLYEPSDTVRDLRDDAADLRELLDQIAIEHPGVPVDLIAHSQGGLIAREALARDYDSPTHRLPPIGHLVTLATPHHGADIATFNAWLAYTPQGQAIRAISHVVQTPFDITGPGIAELSETSGFILKLNARSLRQGVNYTSIGAAKDFVVPAVRARLRGASNVLVDVGSLNFIDNSAHSAIKGADSTHRELALALADMAPTCQSVATTAARAFTGVGIAEGENFVTSGPVP